MTMWRMAIGALLVAASSHSAAQGIARQTGASLKILDPVAITLIRNPALEVLLSSGVPPMFTHGAEGRFGLVTEVSDSEAAALGVTIDRSASESNGSRVFLVVAEFN